jgi:hypothetical protein
VEEFPSVKVEVKNGGVFVNIQGSLPEEQQTVDMIRRIANRAAGIEVQVQYTLRP